MRRLLVTLDGTFKLGGACGTLCGEDEGDGVLAVERSIDWEELVDGLLFCDEFIEGPVTGPPNELVLAIKDRSCCIKCPFLSRFFGNVG